jgi:hypothetical protein
MRVRNTKHNISHHLPFKIVNVMQKIEQMLPKFNFKDVAAADAETKRHFLCALDGNRWGT